MTFMSRLVKYMSTGKQHRQRDADADHQRGFDVLEEDGQHDDGQCSARHAGEDAADDDGDIVALIGQHHDVQTKIVLGFQLLEGAQAVSRRRWHWR